MLNFHRSFNLLRATLVLCLISIYFTAHAAVIGANNIGSNNNNIQAAPLVKATPDMPGIPANIAMPYLKDPIVAQAINNNAPAEPTPLPAPAKPVVKNKRDAAFEALLNQALPMSPDQIEEMRRLFDVAEEAKFKTPKAPPTPISSSTRVNLEPGSVPPIIRLSAGFVTSLNFIDTTGAPWPIASYGIGDPQAFNIQWDQHSNTLFIQSLRIYSHGNMAIKLKDLDTPIMISMVSGQKEVDFRVDLQVAGRGPQASAPILPQSVTTPAQVNPMLINFLDGLPPQGSTKLDAGRYGEAWIYQNKMYFRSKLKLLSPAWMATVSSPDGTHVYEMIKTPLILATENGVTVNIVLKGM